MKLCQILKHSVKLSQMFVKLDWSFKRLINFWTDFLVTTESNIKKLLEIWLINQKYEELNAILLNHLKLERILQIKINLC